MESELATLEQKLDQVLALCRSLRAENHELRAQVAGLEDDRQRLAAKMDAARGRLQGLMARLPQS